MRSPVLDDATLDAEIAAIRREIAERPVDADLAATRHRLDATGEGYGLPPGVEVEPVDAGGVPGEWAIPDARDEERHVLYIHGGGFAVGSIASDRHLAAILARESRARVLAIDYRRAPENPFPAALDDACRAYRFLLARGVAPRRLAVAGLSAGGGLALSLLISARDQDIALPACVWLGSPWTDLTNSGDSMQSHAAIDPIIGKDLLDAQAAAYLHGASRRDPLASPSFGDLRGLPPMLVQVGAAETMLDDSIKLSRVAGTANVPVTLEIWPRMIHAFHLLSPDLAAARAALTTAGAYIRAMTGGGALKP